MLLHASSLRYMREDATEYIIAETQLLYSKVQGKPLSWTLPKRCFQAKLNWEGWGEPQGLTAHPGSCVTPVATDSLKRGALQREQPCRSLKYQDKIIEKKKTNRFSATGNQGS